MTVVSYMYHPDSSSGRAPASGLGGSGFHTWCAIPKALKLVPVDTLLCNQHNKASTGSPLIRPHSLPTILTLHIYSTNKQNTNSQHCVPTNPSDVPFGG